MRYWDFNERLYELSNSFARLLYHEQKTYSKELVLKVVFIDTVKYALLFQKVLVRVIEGFMDAFLSLFIFFLSFARLSHTNRKTHGNLDISLLLGIFYNKGDSSKVKKVSKKINNNKKKHPKENKNYPIYGKTLHITHLKVQQCK